MKYFWRTLLALGLSCAAFYFLFDTLRLPTVERNDLLTYARLDLPGLSFPFFSYSVLLKGNRLAATDDPPKYRRTKLDWSQANSAFFAQKRAWLRRNVYHGRSILRVVWMPATFAAGVFLAVLFWPSRLTSTRRIRGPRLIPRWRWNLRGWFQSNNLYLRTRFGGRIVIRRKDLSKHMQLVGVTGTGKSTVIRQLVRQAMAQGMCCVFLDMAGEYTEEYYRPGWDYLINPADSRCCRWMIGEEATHELQAMGISEGAFPDTEQRSFFFQDHARGIFTWTIAGDHPLRQEVSTSNLARWMANSKILDYIVRGTEHAETLSKNAAEQRAGIIGTLNHVARGLRWMPDDEGRQEFTVKDWGKERNRHIFLSSTASTFAAVRPMQSMIFDMILLHLQSNRGRPVLIVADEIGEFQRCPQLRRAITMQRKNDCPILLAYQGFSQLEEAYGDKDAETIVTNPYTNVILRTTGKKSAEVASALLGLPAQVVHRRESKTLRGLFYSHPHRTLSDQLAMESPVISGEIQSFRDGCGVVAQAGESTPFQVKWIPKQPKQPRLVERFSADSQEKAQLLKDSEKAKLFEFQMKAYSKGWKLVPLTAPQESTEDSFEEPPKKKYKNIYSQRQ